MTMKSAGEEQVNIVDERLYLGRGFADDERPGIVERFTPLEKRLRSHPLSSVDLLLNVKNRDRAEQKVTLECRLAGADPLVATSGEEDMTSALNEVRDDLLQQLDKLKTKRDPRQDRHQQRRP
ncbi:HPF/RaiA family ribosome-associated protein [Streptosporangium sandarakinum]|uniref:Ribosomal subunit interface protein n=1 Tax=Streptosporangium sandarakinum TaxID=1260955 RepID=A0A852UZH4_9ACTN|nr:HPF/RaiA family ribosome-associated protein [Streptosporangium sandarakinum]NYF43057.1 ribosomal subunit interface protein [Streptosporangium sandarakinum]